MSCSHVLRIYHPFIGSTTDPNAPTPPPLTPPTITPISQITLTCADPVLSITIRNPRLGDKNELQYQRINRESRNGRLIIFASSDWPRIEKLILEFEGLTEAKTDEIFTFSWYATGNIVTLTDWENNTWTGFMQMGTVVRNKDNCGNAVTIEFEGERV